MTMPPPPAPYTTAHVPGTGPQASVRGMLLGARLASWPRRSAATFIDLALTVLIPVDVIGHSFGWWLCVALVAFNSGFMQTRTTQSFGKVILSIYLTWPVTDRQDENVAAKPSPIRCLLRIPLHLLDSIFLIGFLRPLWNNNRQTFADSITKTVVLGEPMGFIRAPAHSRSIL